MTTRDEVEVGVQPELVDGLGRVFYGQARRAGYLWFYEEWDSAAQTMRRFPLRPRNAIIQDLP